MFNVSTMTIQRALKKLTDDGFLIARPGIGLFTNPEHRWKYGNINVIGVLVADGKQIYFEKYLWELLSAVGKEITGSRKLLYLVNFLSEADNLEECVAGIPLKGLIWLDPEFEPSVAVEEFVNSLTIPAVVVNGHRPGHSCVCGDWEREGYEIGRKLLAEGRRRPLLAAKHDHMPQLDGLRRAFAEAGVPLDTDEMLILRGLEMEENLNRLLDRIGTPEAIYAIGGTIRDIEATLQKRKPDLGKCRLIGEPVVLEPYFRGWRVEHDFEILAKTACRQLFAEMEGARQQNYDIARQISEVS